MTFTSDQVKALSAKLDPGRVTQRTQSGRTFDYIEGWFAISEANRIFGFDGWSRETVLLIELRAAELVTVTDKYGKSKDQWRVGYMAKVRITVNATVREGTGFGSGAMGDLGEAIESAIKEAETDAMKRALMTFGNPFGLALYDKSRENVGVDAPGEPAKVDGRGYPAKVGVTGNQASKADSREAYTKLEKSMRQNRTPDDLRAWWNDADCKPLRQALPADWQETLKAAFVALGEELVAKQQADETPFDSEDQRIADELRNHPMGAM